jgi:hypothetical protein
MWSCSVVPIALVSLDPFEGGDQAADSAPDATRPPTGRRRPPDVHDNLASIREVINVANAEFRATTDQYRLLARKSINQADLQRYIQKVLKVEDDQEAGTRMKNIIVEIVGWAEAGRGNDLPSVRGTYWTAYNGVTEWLTYSRGHSQQNRLNSLWFGDGASLNRQALEVTLDMAA